MKRLALMAGALMLVATFVTSGSYAAEPVKTRPSVQVQTVTGMPVTTVGWRGYGRGYYGGPRGYYGYYGPRYRSNYYYGPTYRTNYYRGYSYPPAYYGPSYYGPSYYGRPGGAVNVYPGGVDVGGVHVGW
jgi:hypothetical protein